MVRGLLRSREEKRRFKFLAPNDRRTQAPGKMNTALRSANRRRAFVTALTSAAFLWTLVLSDSPQLHQRIHRDANRVDHSCAVTLVASGNFNHCPVAPLVTAPVPVAQFSVVSALTPQWVESPFLGGRVFEHAPPALT